MIYLTGTIISFFLCFILISKKNNSQADIILAVWLFFTGLHLLLFNRVISRQYSEGAFLLGVELPLPLIHGPFLFLYVSALTRKTPLRKSALFHFLPFISAYLLLTPFFAQSARHKISTYENDGANYELWMGVLFYTSIVSGVLYSLLSIQKLNNHQKNIGEMFSYTERVNLLWLRYLIAGSGLIWLVVVFGSDAFIYGIITLYVLFIGYFGIKQVGIFTSIDGKGSVQMTTETESIDIIPYTGKEKYEKSSLTEEQIVGIHQRLADLMQSEKIYTNPELTLAGLAQRLGVHPNVLSQVINTKEQRNFFDYINCFRVNAFKYMVTQPENQKFTLLALAFDCGFNSKTSFNRNFKKATGLSPTEYLSQANIRLL